MVERDHVKVISYKLDRLKNTDVCDSKPSKDATQKVNSLVIPNVGSHVGEHPALDSPAVRAPKFKRLFLILRSISTSVETFALR
jgi:hypothetical protein